MNIVNKMLNDFDQTGDDSRVVSDEQHLEQQSLEQNRNIMRSFVVLLIGAAAATTFTLGPIVQMDVPGFFEMPRHLILWGLIKGVVLGLLLLILLDGARLGWSKGKVAAGTVGAQQWLAFGMEILNFLGSGAASIVSLSPVLNFFNLGVPYNPEFSLWTLKMLLISSFATNLVGVFLYTLLSPHNRKLRSIAQMRAGKESTYLVKLEKAFSQSNESLGQEIDKVLGGIARDITMSDLTQFMMELGYLDEKGAKLIAAQQKSGKLPTPNDNQITGGNVNKSLSTPEQPPVINITTSTPAPTPKPAQNGRSSQNGPGKKYWIPEVDPVNAMREPEFKEPDTGRYARNGTNGTGGGSPK